MNTNIRTEGGFDTVEGEDGDPKPVSDYGRDEVTTRNVWAGHNPEEFRHVMESIREGDQVRVNDRKRALEAYRVSYSVGGDIAIYLRGNGAGYRLICDPGENSAVLHVGSSGTEGVERVQVTNRNLFNIAHYESLMSEEMEAIGDTVSHAGAELDAIREALDLMVEHDRSRENYGQALRDWNALRLRIQDADEWTFHGREAGMIGAALDYAVEDQDAAERAEQGVLDAINALRAGEPIPEGFGTDSDRDSDSDGADADSDRLMTDGGSDSSQDGDGEEWNPEPAQLREGETRDEMSHAEINAIAVRRARRLLGREEQGAEDTDGDPEIATDGGVEKIAAEVEETVPKVADVSAELWFIAEQVSVGDTLRVNYPRFGIEHEARAKVSSVERVNDSVDVRFGEGNYLHLNADTGDYYFQDHLPRSPEDGYQVTRIALYPGSDDGGGSAGGGSA